MDARLDPASLAGLKEGEAHVIGNAAGDASDDAIECLIQLEAGALINVAEACSEGLNRSTDDHRSDSDPTRLFDRAQGRKIDPGSATSCGSARH